MKTRLTMAAALGALLVAAPQLSAQQQQEMASGALTEADIAAIKKVTQEWASHAKMGHAAVVAKLYTEDAMELPPDQPAIKGRASIEQRIAESVTGLQDIKITSVETHGMLDLAYDRGTYSVTVKEEGMDEPVKINGKYISILRRQADGTWKLTRLIWNEDTPPPGSSDM